MKRCLTCDHQFEGPTWTCPGCDSTPAVLHGFRCFAPELAASPQGYDPAHFPTLVRMEERSFWCRGRNRLIVWAMRRFFPNARRILEVGVGTGYVIRDIQLAMPSAVVSASDMTIEALQLAGARVGTAVELCQMDARHVPFRNEFDVICAFDVLEHIADDEAVIAELAAALRPAGGLLLTVPQHTFLWGPADDAADHVRRYSYQELGAKVSAAGLDVLLKTSFVSFLLPALYVARMRSRMSGRYSLESEHDVPAVINGIFNLCMDAERTGIRLGLRLPMGGSQLLVAGKR